MDRLNTVRQLIVEEATKLLDREASLRAVMLRGLNHMMEQSNREPVEDVEMNTLRDIISDAQGDLWYWVKEDETLFPTCGTTMLVAMKVSKRRDGEAWPFIKY